MKKLKRKIAEIKRSIRLSPLIAKIKIIAFLIAVILIVGLIKTAKTDYNMDCTKESKTCTISTSSLLNPKPFPISRFNASRVIDAFVEARSLKDGTVIYDILLDYGPNEGKLFIDYGYNTKIKTNTAKMKFIQYINTPMEEFHITKHCYFNSYFCF